VADIIVVLSSDEGLWTAASPEEIAKDWDAWTIAGKNSPKHLRKDSYCWVCHRGAIRAYCTIRDLKRDDDGLDIIFHSYYRFDGLGIDPIPRPDIQWPTRWKYGHFRKYLPEWTKKETSVDSKIFCDCGSLLQPILQNGQVNMQCNSCGKINDG